MRHAIEQPELGWRRLANNRVMPLYRGELCFPELASRVIRTAMILVRVSNRKVVGIFRIEISEYKMDAKGAVDQDEVLRCMIDKNNGNYIGPGITTPSIAEAMAIKRCLGIASTAS